MGELLERIIGEVIDPALAAMPEALDTPEARVMLLAIGLQESRFLYRRQKGNGPARGFWQFERMGGTHGVLTHPASRGLARIACDAHHVQPAARPVWQRLESDDELACKFARLLLLTDPRALPDIGQGGEAWDYYLDNWRPGKPHPSTWGGFYAQAMEAVL